MSEEYKITTGTISSEILKSIDIEPSIVVDGKSYTASEFNKAVEMLKQPTLNENQQIVLEWLKSYSCNEAVTAIDTVGKFWVTRNELGQPNNWRLNHKQQAQVLQAFASWVLSEESL